MNPVRQLIQQKQFQAQAKQFAKWYAHERKAVLELGKIAAGWLEHYSRIRNAEHFAEAIHQLTGLRTTGRTIRYYRAIYQMYQSWMSRPSGTKSGNHFQISHVGPGHLRVAAGARMPLSRKCSLLDEAERRRLTVKQTVAKARQMEMEVVKAKRMVRQTDTGPRVVCGDAIDVVQQLAQGSIYHLFADWQWDNKGIWREQERNLPVHRPSDPVKHLCDLLRIARSYLATQCIVWIFSKATAFENGQIGLPWPLQKTAHEAGLVYCSEYINIFPMAGYRSSSSFMAVKHNPIYAYVPEGFDYSPAQFITSVGKSRWSSKRNKGIEKHPYQKAVELFETLIAAGTSGGLVFDAFAGSGSAGVAAIRCGCSYLGAELVPQYARAANRALATAMAKDNSCSA